MIGIFPKLRFFISRNWFSVFYWQ